MFTKKEIKQWFIFFIVFMFFVSGLYVLSMALSLPIRTYKLYCDLGFVFGENTCENYYQTIFLYVVSFVLIIVSFLVGYKNR